MAKRMTVENVDPGLLSRIATLSPGGQRWLKTAIQTMRTMPVGTDDASELRPSRRPNCFAPTVATRRHRRSRPDRPMLKISALAT
jgi:hypothetical protein